MNITLIGGHGKVALLTAPLLAAAGHKVTSWIRSEAHASDVRAGGAEPVLADVEAMGPAELRERLTGQDAVVWAAGAGGGNPERTYAVDRDAAVASMAAAAETGARRFVMVSYIGSRPEHGVSPENAFFAYAEAKAAADEALRRSALDWTILGPSTLTDDAPSGRIALDGDPSVPVSRGNVALMIAAVLGRADTVGRTLRFTDGEEPIVLGQG